MNVARIGIVVAAVATAMLTTLVQPRAAAACSPAPACPALVPIAPGGPDLQPVDDETAGHEASRLLGAAASDSRPVLVTLGQTLRDPATLARLESIDRAGACILTPILTALARNAQPRARTELLSLVRAKAWQDQPDRHDGSARREALLVATSFVTAPPPAVVTLWTGLAKPDDGWVNVTTNVLVANGSKPALALFARLVTSRVHDLDTRIAWLSSAYLPHRDQPAVLAMATRLLAGSLPDALRVALVDATLGPSPSRTTCPGPTAPALASYSPAARVALRTFLTAARKRALPPAQTAALVTTVAELDRLDATP